MPSGSAETSVRLARSTHSTYSFPPERWSGCSARMARARPPPCWCLRHCFVRRVVVHECSGTTSRAPVHDVRHHLGLVFQEASVDGLLTVEENLLFAARLAGFGNQSARQAAADAMERVGLTERQSQPARHLSTGWRRLIDLARATLHRPALLVLDEPTVGLDPEHRDRAWRLLETERRERGTTVLFSTHYLAEAEACDRVVLLARGRVVTS